MLLQHQNACCGKFIVLKITGFACTNPLPIVEAHLPVVEGVFDVVAGGVDEDSMFIPTSTLQAHVLIHSTHTLQLPVTHTQHYIEI